MENLKWEIGNVEVFQIVEIEENKLFNTFIPVAKPSVIKKDKSLFPNFADSKGNLKALVQSFFIKSNERNILIEAGIGNGKNRPLTPSWGNLDTNFLGKFKKLGVTPEEIDVVVCTHLHFDHVGWNTRLENGKWIPTFKNAKYLFSKKEYEYWTKKPEKEVVDDFNGIDDSVVPIVKAGLAKFVPDDYQVDENIRFFPTPGHTPHHISVMIESNGKKAVISGDVMHHPCQIAHPDWTTLADTFPEQTVTTREKFFKQYANTDTLVISSHFSYPVAGYIVEENGRYSQVED